MYSVVNPKFRGVALQAVGNTEHMPSTVLGADSLRYPSKEWLLMLLILAMGGPGPLVCPKCQWQGQSQIWSDSHNRDWGVVGGWGLTTTRAEGGAEHSMKTEGGVEPTASSEGKGCSLQSLRGE